MRFQNKCGIEVYAPFMYTGGASVCDGCVDARTVRRQDVCQAASVAEPSGGGGGGMSEKAPRSAHEVRVPMLVKQSRR
jgi:hypothetical protein